jgi:hypothetical protein
MIYMLKVNMLVAAVVFGFAGLVILVRFAWTEAIENRDALRVMQYITTAAPHDRFAISRMGSRNRNPNTAHAA